VRDFFWHGNAINDAEFFGDVLEFEESDKAATTTPTGD
jgi:hypothetical protein